MKKIVTSNGRVTIPVEIRRQFGIGEGTHICFDLDERERTIILTPITREYVHSLRGKYRGRGVMKALMAEKKQDGAIDGLSMSGID